MDFLFSHGMVLRVAQFTHRLDIAFTVAQGARNAKYGVNAHCNTLQHTAPRCNTGALVLRVPQFTDRVAVANTVAWSTCDAKHGVIIHCGKH